MCDLSPSTMNKSNALSRCWEVSHGLNLGKVPVPKKSSISRSRFHCNTQSRWVRGGLVKQSRSWEMPWERSMCFSTRNLLCGTCRSNSSSNFASTRLSRTLLSQSSNTILDRAPPLYPRPLAHISLAYTSMLARSSAKPMSSWIRSSVSMANFPPGCSLRSSSRAYMTSPAVSVSLCPTRSAALSMYADSIARSSAFLSGVTMAEGPPTRYPINRRTKTWVNSDSATLTSGSATPAPTAPSTPTYPPVA
mmetsp:Transcript_52233/g.138434  ORF Transcript_52233/g.138434 Transcript_52233/m.138434 type:complete len:249 (-) Transcript_52233:854-1600(-)